MTHEEAIANLNSLLMRADLTDEYGEMEDMTPYEEAVEMAIEALKERKTDTCTNDGKDCSEYDQFVCSKCGIELLDWTRYIGDECDEYAFKFCPNCGRKIVEGAEE